MSPKQSATLVNQPAYVALLEEIKRRIRSAQYEALRAVNQQLVSLYWDIGRMIVARQKGDTWGRAVVQQLACDLQAEFPGMKGFSSSNLWRMRLFYQCYHGVEKLAPLVREISWSSNLIIMEKCKEDLDVSFISE